MIKLCCTASVGGHLQELLQLSEMTKKYKNILITESENISDGFDKIFYLKQMDRKNVMGYIYLLFSLRYIFKILSQERPTHIISTGAMCTIPVCIIGKLLKIKVIYIESFARITELSLTGKVMYRFADLFIVQWEPLAAKYRKAVYGGGLF